MREPWFWRTQSAVAKMLTGLMAPAAVAYQAGQRIRWSLTRSVHASIPVICIGNASLGGVGKTPFAMLVDDVSFRIDDEGGIEEAVLDDIRLEDLGLSDQIHLPLLGNFGQSLGFLSG